MNGHIPPLSVSTHHNGCVETVFTWAIITFGRELEQHFTLRQVYTKKIADIQTDMLHRDITQ